MTLTAVAKPKEIPAYLIYELDEGMPIYYKGYRDVLLGQKNPEEVMTDSTLQAWLKMELGSIIRALLSSLYIITGGEQGLQLGKSKTRAADLAIFTKENFVLSTKYSANPPEIAIEIDTKADLDSPGATIDYFDRKNQQLLAFGVKKIIWIFTDAQIVKVILPGEEIQTFAWEEDVPVMDGIHFNLQKIMDQLKAE